MIRKQTWIVVILLAALVGFAYYLKDQKKIEEANATPTAGTTFVFDSSEGEPARIEVVSDLGDTIIIARDADNAWTIELPFAAEADQGIAEAAATQIASLKVISDVDGDPDIFGLEAPVYVITVDFTGGKKHKLEVGDNTPTNSGYYIRLDGDRIFIVGLSGIDSLTNLVFFPPFLNTPTPSPLPPTGSPVPVLETPALEPAESSATQTP